MSADDLFLVFPECACQEQTTASANSTNMLMENLGIRDAIVVNENLSEEDQELLNMGRIARQHGMTGEKLEQLLKDNDAKEKAKKQVKSIQKEEIATANGKQGNSKPANDSFQQELQDEQLINSASTSSQVAPSSALIAETDSSKQGNVQRSKMLTEEQRAYIEEQSGEAENKATQPVETTVLRRPRDPKIKEYVLERENGICLLCGKQGPFEYNGRYFLEAHHIIPCKDGRADTPENQAALCPNCHRKMHCLNLPEDVLKLKEKVSKTKKNNNEKKWELHT
ncbi:MAG: HNH endonuclease [Lentisphaeria bacterium]|nr:HNH endonuclease [Lentisphaeria bacterium]